MNKTETYLIKLSFPDKTQTKYKNFALDNIPDFNPDYIHVLF